MRTHESFIRRHLGPSDADVASMLRVVGATSLQELIDQTVPQSIMLTEPLKLPAPMTEVETLQALREMADENQVWRSFLGMGYYRCHTPTVILRNLIENPSWYTSYTPYQAEISQGHGISA